jgi:hypothetical protein
MGINVNRTEATKPSFWRDGWDETNVQEESTARPTFFQPGRLYAAHLPGSVTFRFRCESVATDSETGQPLAHGQHGKLRTADGEWIWTPNDRTWGDWRSRVWTDITDEA